MDLKLLSHTEFVVFNTRDYARASGSSLSSASRLLNSMAKHKRLTRVSRGIWANTAHPYFTPMACVPLLLGKETGYVSFLTALHRQGLISQIPASIQVATTGHSRISRTPIGVFEFLKLKPELMQEGVAWSETKRPYPMATLEKALLDTLYIATRKNKRFSSLPELTLEESDFSSRKFFLLLKHYKTTAQIKSAIHHRFSMKVIG